MAIDPELRDAAHFVPAPADATIGGGAATMNGGHQTVPDDGVDVSLIRWMLGLSPEERLAVLQGFVDSVAEISGAATHA